MSQSRTDTLTPAFSLYLDAVRLCGACLVLIAHMAQYGLLPARMPFDDLGHEAVMAFFVLSGIVIARSALHGASTFRQFAIARAARLYSVVIPALVLSHLLAHLFETRATDPSAASYAGFGTALVGIASSLTFLNESWFHWRDVPWNGPYWSLCYEAWYYVLFGVAVFARARTRWVLLLVAGAIAGPRILILLPVWWVGVIFFQRAATVSHRPVAGLIVFVASIAAFWTLGQTSSDIVVRDALKSVLPEIWVLKASELFVTDYIFGALVVTNFLGFKMIEPSLGSWVSTLNRPVRWLAGYTFSIYLFHYPLLLTLRRYISEEVATSWAFSAAIFVGIAGICVLLGTVTENQKNRLRMFLESAIPMASRSRRVV